MHPQIERIRITRNLVLDLTKNLSTAQLNEIPAGFNNNIIWNMGHLIAAQQGICYVRAGLKYHIEDQFFLSYKPGSRPDTFIDENAIEIIKELLVSTLDVFNKDVELNAFVNYTSWTTRFGAPINNIEDALAFLMLHEGLHTGYIMALKHIISK